MNVEGRVRELLEPELALLGYELILVELVGQRRSILRLFIDRDAGVSIDDCVKASRAASNILDEADLFQSPYRLEVSSPGVDRPLTRPAHFSRFEGDRVKVYLLEGDPRGRSLIGRLGPSNEVGFELRPDDARGSNEGPGVESEESAWISLNYDEVTKVHVVANEAIGKPRGVSRPRGGRGKKAKKRGKRRDAKP